MSPGPSGGDVSSDAESGPEGSEGSEVPVDVAASG